MGGIAGLLRGALAVLALLIAFAGVLRIVDVDEADSSRAPSKAQAEPAADPANREDRPPVRRRLFTENTMLVAYYGTAGTGSLGVLGEGSLPRITTRLRRAAVAFERPKQPVQPVFELIVNVADSFPGKSGAYSHDIEREAVRRYVDHARKEGILVVLDIQAGRSAFPTVARRWEWALRQPHVGLALDPEWRMGRGQVPGRTIGSVRASEVNLVSAWLAGLVRKHELPEKIFMLHQFRTDMVSDIGAIKPRPGLAMVQHIDGFGNRAQKLATYLQVARPRAFTMGFKLFYDEDFNLMGSGEVIRLKPRVRFVSYQ